eukprot:Opistho-2@89787
MEKTVVPTFTSSSMSSSMLSSSIVFGSATGAWFTPGENVGLDVAVGVAVLNKSETSGVSEGSNTNSRRTWSAAAALTRSTRHRASVVRDPRAILAQGPYGSDPLDSEKCEIRPSLLPRQDSAKSICKEAIAGMCLTASQALHSPV